MSTRLQTQIKAAPIQSFAPIHTGILQRKCASSECPERSKKRLMLQRRSTSETEPSEVPPIVHEVLRSPGQPLDPVTRAYMEPRFGHDFSRVRVHTDAKAAESAQVVNALAYTVGHDVVFGTEQYAPGTAEGRELLAHELAHTVQQRQTRTALSTVTIAPSYPRDIAEQEAGKILHSFLDEASVSLNKSITQHSLLSIQRQINRAFTEEQFKPVREAFEENVKKTTRDSCIVIVNKGLRRLFTEQMKGQRLGSEMEKTMARLNALHLADKPIEIQFLDAKGRLTKGTIAPDSLSSSAKSAVLAAVGPETGWYLFGLSIMDGYHSVLLAVDYRNSSVAKIYWMDQIYSGFDDVTGSLDERIIRLTKQWWKAVKEAKGVGYNTVVRIWPIIERLLGDFPIPQILPSQTVG